LADEPRRTVRQIMRGLWLTYPHEKRAADYRMALVVGAVYRPLSFGIAAVLIKLGVSANQVTYARYCVILAECVSFTSGTHPGMVAGSLCHVCHYLLDFVDGNIARYHGRPTRFGALLDGMADRLGYILPPLMIGIGLYRRPDGLLLALPGPVPQWLPLTLGVIASLGTVLLLSWNPRRWWEFLGLLRGGYGTSPPEIRAEGHLAGHPPPSPTVLRPFEVVFSNAAHVLETAVVVLAMYDLVAAFLGFRFVYYAASRVWTVADRILTAGHR
jgi:phosphatidylglycerophosphate synthase